MKQHTVVIILIFFTVPLFAQKKLNMHNTFGGARFELDSTVVTMRQVSQILSVDPVAGEEFKKARFNAGVASVLGFSGGFLIGFPVGTAIAGGKPEWVLAGIGAAAVIASIPFSKAFKKKAQSAVDHYNAGQPSSRLRGRVYLSGCGASVQLKF